jgi:type 1 glutamine amidotransferase
VRIALDTNVLVSAVATRGLCADILNLVLAKHQLVVGVTVLAELTSSAAKASWRGIARRLIQQWCQCASMKLGKRGRTIGHVERGYDGIMSAQGILDPAIAPSSTQLRVASQVMRLTVPFHAILLTAAGLASTSYGQSAEPALLVFTKTVEYRHESIPAGVQMLRELGEDNGFDVEHTEDSAVFERESLAGYAAIVFLSTTGDVLDAQQQEGFDQYIRNGGAYVGIHAAADTEHDWPWYATLVGAWFSDHPEIQQAAVDIEDSGHVSTRMLPARWMRTDEWYNYDRNPRNDVHVLMTLDEETYGGGKHEGDHPIAWCHEPDSARSWYTGGGHTEESYAEPLFRQHVLGGIQWAIGVAGGDC